MQPDLHKTHAANTKLPSMMMMMMMVIITTINEGEISGSHGGEYEDCLLGNCAGLSGRSLPTFQRCLMPPYSGR
jgi:hypothetical protein